VGLSHDGYPRYLAYHLFSGTHVRVTTPVSGTHGYLVRSLRIIYSSRLMALTNNVQYGTDPKVGSRTFTSKTLANPFLFITVLEHMDQNRSPFKYQPFRFFGKYVCCMYFLFDNFGLYRAIALIPSRLLVVRYYNRFRATRYALSYTGLW
jgi:hypothetical protein